MTNESNTPAVGCDSTSPQSLILAVYTNPEDSIAVKDKIKDALDSSEDSISINLKVNFSDIENRADGTDRMEITLQGDQIDSSCAIDMIGEISGVLTSGVVTNGIAVRSTIAGAIYDIEKVL